MLVKTSKNQQKNQQKLQKNQDNLGQIYQLSSDLAHQLEQVVRNGLNSIRIISFEKMSQLCQQELRRITKFKESHQKSDEIFDNELTVTVVGIQSRIILEERRQVDFNGSRLSLPDKKKEGQNSKHQSIVKRYQNLIREIQKSQSQIQNFINQQGDQIKVDFASCFFFFVSHVKKLRKLQKEKLISSRVKLLHTIIFFLREAASELQPQIAQKLKANYSLQGIIYDANASFLDSPRSNYKSQIVTQEEVNNWHSYSSRFVEDKVLELCGICQQIPQLQTYKRTLQFVQLQSSQKVAFFKIVDVLISLHHKVSYLVRSKPQLMKQLQHGKCQIDFMNLRVEEFLAQMMNETNQIFPISFEGLDQRWKSQFSQDLIDLRGHLHKLSGIIIRQDQIHTQNYAKVDRLIKIVQLFGKVLTGESQFAEQWELLINQQQGKDNQTVCNEEYRVIMLLQQCLAILQSRIDQLQQNESNLANRTNEQLEIEVNKLIQDYERLKGDNTQLINTLQMERRLREGLLVEIDERDTMIKNLSAKKLTLQKKQAKQDGESVTSSKYTDREFRRLQHEGQKYLQSSLLLKQQLKVSQAERQRLIEQLQIDKQQYLRGLQAINRLKPQKQKLQIQCEELQNRLQAHKNQQLRQINRLNKTISELTNEKVLLQNQIDSAQRNNIRLIDRLELNDKKLAQYNKLMIARLDEKDDNSLLRLQRQLQKYKKESQNFQRDAHQFQMLNKGLKDELKHLKYKFRQHQLNKEGYGQSQNTLLQMKSKIQKLQTKNNKLTNCLEEAKNKEEQLQEKLKTLSRKIRQLQNRQRDAQSQKNRFAKLTQQAQRRSQDLQRQLDDIRHWNEKQARVARQMLSKRELQLMQKITYFNSLQIKVRMLEEQLSQKSSQSDKVAHQLITTKVKQYEKTVQTYKLIELKLQQKAKALQKELQEKIEIEFKLSSQIGRLSKQIDRMKAQLQKYLRELTQKQTIIKIQRQKIDQQVKQIRQYQVKQKVREQQMLTPHHDKLYHGEQNTSTPSQFQDPMSRSNAKYDNYFNAKEYDRLSKEYGDFKKHASQKLQALQSSLEQALKEKAKLKAQLSMSSSKDKQLNIKFEFSRQKYEEVMQEIRLQSQKNGCLQEKVSTLTNQNHNLTLEFQKTAQKYSQQANLLQSMRIEKQQFADKLSKQLLEKQKLKFSITKDTQWAQKTKSLQDKISSLEQINRQLKQTHSRLQIQMQTQIKNMFNHYESEMKRVIAELDGKNQRLVAEVNFLKQQLQVQQNASKIGKDETLNELKKTIQQLLSQKSKLLVEYTRLQNQKAMNESQRIQHIKEITQLKQQNSYQIQLINKFQEKAKISNQLGESQTKINELNLHITNLLKQRDLLHQQHDFTKTKLQQQIKKTLNFESLLSKQNGELQLSKKLNLQLQTHIKAQNQNIKDNTSGKNKKSNEQYLQAKIQSLEEALQSVGRELADCKILKSQVKILTKPQSERPIITSLPDEGIPASSTYFEGTIAKKVELIGVQKIIQGKRRWQNGHFLQSLSKWGVPTSLCQQIQELRTLFMSTSQLIGSISQQQIALHQMIGSLPSLENLMQYVLRILTFFSEVPLDSAQALKIRSQLQTISKKYTGGYFFTVLQQYTIHILQNNAIEEYKRQLRSKARQLLGIKQKLDQLITQQLEHQERIYNRPKPTANRSLEPALYNSSSNSPLNNSRHK